MKDSIDAVDVVCTCLQVCIAKFCRHQDTPEGLVDTVYTLPEYSWINHFSNCSCDIFQYVLLSLKDCPFYSRLPP